MIRNFKETDIDEIAEIWLTTNIEAHNFISAKYWKDNFEIVKVMLLQAEIYVYEDDNLHKISAFIGLDNNYIEGIFVCSKAQSKGIGKMLLDYVKTIKPELNLRVYKNNTRAVKFYQREKFRILNESIDENTNEKEFLMIWK